MTRLMRASLAAAVAVMCGTVRASGTVARATDACDLETLNGTYVFNATGFAVNGGGLTAKAIVEVLEFRGGLITTPSLTLNVNGTTIRSRPGADGIYTLADDCTGTVTFADSGHAAFDIVASHKGERIWMIQTNPAAVFQGTARLVGPVSREEWGRQATAGVVPFENATLFEHAYAGPLRHSRAACGHQLNDQVGDGRRSG